MPIDRMSWKYVHFTNNHAPALPCPGCGKDALSLLKDTFHTVFDRKTNSASSGPYHSSDASGHFVCVLKCERCHETCADAGSYDTDRDVGEDQYGELHEYDYERCHPKFIYPPPPLIRVPEKCPKDIKIETIAAFTSFWNDHSSALNHIRCALEFLLTNAGIPRTTINDKNKRVLLSLHSRIDKLKKKKPNLKNVCERMYAVKHLGNAGSHSENEITVDDVLDGFEILERVLHDTYSDHDSVLARLVAQINKRKGPKKRKG